MFEIQPRALFRGFLVFAIAQAYVVSTVSGQTADTPNPPAEVEKEDTGPVTEDSVEVMDGSSDDLLDQIDIAGQNFNFAGTSPRDRAIAVFTIKKLADKIALRPDATERQKEIALKYSLTYVRKGSEMDPKTFRSIYESLVRQVAAEFPNGSQGALASYMILSDRIAEMGPNANLLGSVKEFQAKYPDSPEAPRPFVDYAEKLLALGRVDETVGVMKDAVAAFQSNERMKNALSTLEGLYKAQADLIGRPMDLTGPKLGGGLLSSRNYAGKALLVIFWMSKSPNSQVEVKNLNELLEKYGSQGLEVLGVSFDANAEELTNFLKENGITWPQIFFQDAAERGPESPIVKKYNISRLPTLIAVGRDGKIAAVSFRGKETMQRIVEELLAAEAPAASGG